LSPIVIRSLPQRSPSSIPVIPLAAILWDALLHQKRSVREVQ
jgi:hypothetical protein